MKSALCLAPHGGQRPEMNELPFLQGARRQVGSARLPLLLSRVPGSPSVQCPAPDSRTPTVADADPERGLGPTLGATASLPYAETLTLLAFI